MHLRKGSMQGLGHRSLLSQNGSTIVGTQTNLHMGAGVGALGQNNMPLIPNGRERHGGQDVMVQSNFLRKRQGRGGSPTEYDVGFVEAETGKRLTYNQHLQQNHSIDSPRKVTGGIIPVRRQNKSTTVRVRTKNNSYVYGN